MASMHKVKKQLGTAVPWLRRHSAIITLLGPFIVFGTFIFKEVLRERQKDLVDDIKSEEHAFAIRNEIHTLYHMVWKLNFNSNSIPKVESSENHPLTTQEIAQWFDSWEEVNNMNLDDIANSLERAEDLYGKLDKPSVAKERSDLAKLKEQLSSYRQRNEVWGKRYSDIVNQAVKEDDWDIFALVLV
jgi:hypothetical protein